MKILLLDDHTLFASSLSIALSDFPEIERFYSTKDVEHLNALLFNTAAGHPAGGYQSGPSYPGRWAGTGKTASGTVSGSENRHPVWL